LGTPQKCSEAYEMGGHGLILAAMRRCCINEMTQAHGCRALGSLTRYVSTARESLLSMGGIDAVVAGMKKFPTSLLVQLYGFVSINNLLVPDSKLVKTQVKRFVENLGGLEIITCALKEFQDTPNIQHYGCRVLHTALCQAQESKQAMIRSEAVIAVATALKNHADHEDVLQAGSDFMSTLFH
jgi:hypothetical protein